MRALILLALLALSALSAEPQYRTIPAASRAERTPSLGVIYNSRNWIRSHGDHASSRYSTLRQITRENVHQLRPAWIYRSGDGVANIQANPIIVDGVLYAPTAGEHVVALDAARGKELWRFRPGARPAARGLAYWPGTSTEEPRLFFTAGDWFYSILARTGKPVATFGTNGRIRARGTVAPSIYRNLVILPCWNVVRAFDLLTCKETWSFHSIPRRGEFGHETWTTPGYGANTWGGMALDEKRGIAYVSTGSPHPNYLGMDYPGENLFANCVIALDAATGERRWHFQEIRHDIWDLDIPAPPNLVTIRWRGKPYDAVAQVTKLGNVLLLDRVTGKPLFPFRLRRAPQSRLEGERTAPYQPDLQLPEPFAPQEFNASHVTTLSPESRRFVLEGIAGAKFGWFAPFDDNSPLVFYGMHGGAEWPGASFDPESGWLYVTSNNLPWVVTVKRVPMLPKRQPPFTAGHRIYLQTCAGCHGREREGGMGPPLFTAPGRLRPEAIQQAIRKGRGSMESISLAEDKFAPLIDFLLERDLPAGTSNHESAERYRFLGYRKLLDQDGRPGIRPPWGTLNAINLNTGRIAWKAPLGEYEELTRQGVPKTGTENFGGATVTAGGLVFCAGTRDRKIRAFDSRNGKELWEYQLPFGGYAPPAVYEVNGRQFVVIAATGGGKLGGELGDAYVAFHLPE